MMDASLSAWVESLLKTVAAEEILPRFRRLEDEDIAEKGPGDLVTTADRRTEERLSGLLPGILPGSTVVGEEAVSAEPRLLERLDGDAPVWIIDPLDGTSNFVRGEERFATIVALACQRRTLAAWIHAPAIGLTAMARAGGGATLNGRPIRVATPRPLSDLEIVVTHPAYQTPEDQRLIRRVGRSLTTRPCTGVGLTYIELASGQESAAVFTWDNPWDHAAGLLLHAEAGGFSAMRNGEPFSLVGDHELPLVIASDRSAVEALRRILRDPR
jgi:fructose-1,6-bisphosphatase/inositol monophosphatase family enzyme